MDFDFLPKLPKSDLDDRKFDDLVNECRLRIPRYCPEWTNYNPGDPGITLVELFAWLTDQMLLRFNQVPRRNYVTFLELLGIRLLPPTPARTALTFSLTTDTRTLTRPQRTIPGGTEVATIRTETEDAVIFTTDRDLTIGKPEIKHFLTASVSDYRIKEHDDTPTVLNNPFSGLLSERNRQWDAINEVNLFEQSPPRPGNCFYLVLTEPNDDLAENPEALDLEGNVVGNLAGNVVAVTFRGDPARGTGILPENPPLRWEAWNGRQWQPILRRREDDKTKGFSFSEAARQTNSLQEGADVILHLPLNLTQTDFGTNYEGYWLRCVFAPEERQQRYSISPSIEGLSIRAIGGAVNATQCVRIDRELLGISNGKPNQVFYLQGSPVLERQPGEHIQVELPGQQTPEEHVDWQEVPDFADSPPGVPHYTIDSHTGTVQFGPLVRDPSHLKQQTLQREQIQDWGKTTHPDPGFALPASNRSSSTLERQYGKVPPPGTEIYMTTYRTGGGSRGNVQKEKLTVLKTAIPYVKSVINYNKADGGVDAESLSQAVMRVPQWLRTRETAVTPEDFERVARKANPFLVARAHCITDPTQNTPGVVRLLVVPAVDIDRVDTQGMSPEQFKLSEDLKRETLKYMADRKPLGIQVKLEEPDYIGVKVSLEVIPESRYSDPEAQAEFQEKIRAQILATLYRFLNPLIGGMSPVTGKMNNEGWDWGRPVYPAEIIALCRQVPGVLHLGAVKLFRVRHEVDGWRRIEVPELSIAPGHSNLICSWADESLDSTHTIEFIR